MLSASMQDALNDQLTAEYAAFYTYLSMEGYFHRQNLDGFAHWMRLQSDEEATHARKLFDYIHDRDGKVLLREIDKPTYDWDSPEAAVEAALAHERRVTKMINALFDQSIAESDHATRIFLHWFVTEQVEEEASCDRILQRLRLGDGSPSVLLMLDRELAQRSAE